MNRKLLTETEIYFGIDTLQVQSDSMSVVDKKDVDYINRYVCIDTENDRYTYRLNPDKANNNVQLFRYNDYEEICNFMINQMKLTNPRKTRIDYRVDSFDNNFDQLLKLNKLVILLLSTEYKLHNRYHSDDPLTLDELCVRVQNDRLEVENYNKAIEEPYGYVKNRLEMRSKHLESEHLDIEAAEFEKWKNRLTKAVTKEHFEQLQNTANMYLIAKYKECVDKYGGTMTVNEFLFKYSGNIWTHRQLINFYEGIGNKNPVNMAKTYKKRKHIEYFSFKDLQIYVNKINDAASLFFMP